MPDRECGLTVSHPVNFEQMSPPWTESARVVSSLDFGGLQQRGHFPFKVVLLRKFPTKRDLRGRGVPCPLPRGVRASCPARSDNPRAPDQSRWSKKHPPSCLDREKAIFSSGGARSSSQECGEGIVGRIPHDFRRTAVRNLVHAGVTERVAMAITGHKTRAVFERYHIVSDGDLREAARRLERAMTAQTATTLATHPSASELQQFSIE